VESRPYNSWLHEYTSLKELSSPLFPETNRVCISETVIPSRVGYRPIPQYMVAGVLHCRVRLTDD
jgi:hypothetical protein